MENELILYCMAYNSIKMILKNIYLNVGRNWKSYTVFLGLQMTQFLRSIEQFLKKIIKLLYAASCLLMNIYLNEKICKKNSMFIIVILTIEKYNGSQLMISKKMENFLEQSKTKQHQEWCDKNNLTEPRPEWASESKFHVSRSWGPIQSWDTNGPGLRQ